MNSSWRSLASFARLGNLARRRGRGHAASRYLLLVTALSVLVGAGWGALLATYGGIESRDHARTPVWSESQEEASLLYAAVHDSLVETHEDVQIVYVEPLSADAPLPPGVSAWPGEGQVIMSPALLASGRDEGIGHRYGDVVGEIGVAGLATPTEKLAYVRAMPGVLDIGVMIGAVGFGSTSDDGFLADAAEIEPLWRFGVAYGLTVGVAWVACVTVAVRSGIERRRETSQRLSVLGANRAERVAWEVGALGPAWFVGFLLGIAVAVPAFVVDLTIPGRHVVVQAIDLRSHAPAVFGTVLVLSTAVLMTAVLLAVQTPRRLAVNRPVPREETFSRPKAGACLIASPMAVMVLTLFQRTASTWSFLLYLGALITVLITVHDLIGVLVERSAGVLRASGRHRQRPATIVAGAGLSSNARPIATAGAFLVVLMVIASQVDGMLVARAQSQRDALSANEHFSGRVVEIYARPGSDLSAVSTILADAREQESAGGLVAVEERSGPDGVTATLGVDAAMTSEISVDDSGRVSPSTSTTTADYLTWLLADIAVDEVEPLDDVVGRAGEADPEDWNTSYRFALMAGPGQTLDDSAVKSLIAHETAPMWRTWAPASSDVAGADSGVRHASWVGWLGTVALLLASTAVGMSLMEDTQLTGTRLAPLGVLAGADRLPRTVTAIRLLVPISIAFGVGALLSGLLGTVAVLSVPGTSLAETVAFIGAAGAVTAVVTGVTAGMSDRHALRALDVWKMGGRGA